MRVAGEGMLNEDDVTGVRVEGAPALQGNSDLGEEDTGVQENVPNAHITKSAVCGRQQRVWGGGVHLSSFRGVLLAIPV